MFVSVHFNQPIFAAPFWNRLFLNYGSQGLYNSQKSDAATLAALLSLNVSSNLGIGDQGVRTADKDGTILGHSPYTNMTAAIIEVGRFEGLDLVAIKAAGSAAKAAAGIKAAL